MTFLSICRDVADEIGVVAPGFVVGNPDLTAKRLFQVGKAQGQSQARAHNWSILHREHEFETTADEANYAVPEDFYKVLGPGVAWDRTNLRELRGNQTPAEWQRLKSSLVASNSFRRNYRLAAGPLAGSIIIDPTPASTGDELLIEYLSLYWCEDADGNGQATLAADTDEIRLDHELFRLGLLWRAKRVLGLDYMDDRADYDVALRAEIIADTNLPIVNTAGLRMYRPGANIPDGSWDL